MAKKNVPPAPTEAEDLKALLFTKIEQPGWQELGACFGTENPAFFEFEQEFVDEAIAICVGCSVRLLCLKSALGIGQKTGQYDGVWGGYAPEQRKRLRRMYLNMKLRQRKQPVSSV